MNEIAINELGDLSELNTFITETNKKVLTLKGIVVATDDDIKPISANIKELKEREGVLKIAEGKLMELAGIKRVGITIENSRSQRLLANKTVQDAKQKIRNDALDFFILNADKLVKNSKASDLYKKTIDTKNIAGEVIAGRAKGFMDLMKTELGRLGLRLENNATETSEKMAIINEYDYDLAHDKDYLVQLPDDILKTTLDERKNNKQALIEHEAQKLADQNERARLAKIEADQIQSDQVDQEIDDQIEADQEIEDEIERARLAKIEDADKETLTIQAKEDAIKKDAMRYRHLKDKDIFSIKELSQQGISALFVGRIPENLILAGDDLDEAIDNEMKLMEKA